MSQYDPNKFSNLKLEDLLHEPLIDVVDWLKSQPDFIGDAIARLVINNQYI